MLVLGKFKNILAAMVMFFSSVPVYAQDDIKLGAYYFDGWTGKTFHPTEKLKNNFPERKPVWGWITSTPKIVDNQILAAKEAGLSFFSFCWYYNPKTGGKDVANDPKNNALNLFIQSKNKQDFEFTLLVANHEGYLIKPEEWDDLCQYWIGLFQNPAYLKVNQKPLITILSIKLLVQSFGSEEKVKTALEMLRNKAVKSGLKGVSIAISLIPDEQAMNSATKCGFDIVTGYNYHNSGLKSLKSETVPLQNMRSKESFAWSTLTTVTKIPIIPAVTLNWDRRPWDKENVKVSPRFLGFSGESVRQSILSLRSWMQSNPSVLVPEKLAILYAWNEYGEGAWLTPSDALKNSLLEGVKAGFSVK